MKKSVSKMMRFMDVGPKPDFKIFFNTMDVPEIEDPAKYALVKVQGTGLNRADLLQKKGLYNA